MVHGSPPLTRGPQGSSVQRVDQDGITPAYAGTTSKFSPVSSHSRDHPRLRGDHASIQSHTGHPSGSPPLTRGPRASVEDLQRGLRITPAYAGTTSTRASECSLSRDHPRLRGDHIPGGPDDGTSLGSPPLTRGPLVVPLGQLPDLGITPAYAGTTGYGSIRRVGRWDHPRLRGDHEPPACPYPSCPGSPPLTRGPLSAIAIQSLLFGITPAYAGTTRIHLLCQSESEDHPRLRGDHPYPIPTRLVIEGSPPLTRGPLLWSVEHIMRARITPAYAGTTHPNVLKRLEYLGSPPLTRGPH